MQGEGQLLGRRQGSLTEVSVGVMSFTSSNLCLFLLFSLFRTQLNPGGSVEQSNSSPTPAALPPSCLEPGRAVSRAGIAGCSEMQSCSWSE